MIVATAGHVDHGKTALVRALTGVDTDRLPEEKARGMSIELGFAYRDARGGGTIGFVDVPGHERLVHAMAAGVAGIHHALLVVAADDGPMPQTREHLQILQALGIASLTVVISKVDRVPAERVAAVEAELTTLLGPLPVFRVCATRGDGIEPLWRHLEALAARWTPPQPRGRFRLAVDRVFTLPGAGLIVTGTAFAGAVAVGDTVSACPGGHVARVRAVHAQNRPAEHARAGERCALNLAGAEARDVRRGDWIVGAPLAVPVERFDARVRISAQAPLRQGARVHLHLGARDCAARLHWLARQEGFVQLVPEEPIGALWGDRFLVRDWSARRTLGGGTVLDPFPPARGRTTPLRLAALHRIEDADAGSALRELLALLPNGVDLERFALARNLDEAAQAEAFGAVDMLRTENLGIAGAHWSALGERILAGIDEAHRAHPASWGPGEPGLRRAVAPDSAPEVFAARVRALLAEGRIARTGARLHVPGHRPVLSPRHLALWQRIEPLLAEGGVRPPSVGHLAAALGMAPPEVEAFLQHLVSLGFVLQVAGNRFYPPQALAELARVAQEIAAGNADGLFSAAQFRDASGIGRNVTIEVLEYFDRCGFTRRSGERRRLLRPAGEVFGRAPG